jgi:hypothetical protein
MSQKHVQWIIGRLLTDEELRLRFLDDRRGTLAVLRDQGFELTASEIDALLRTDRRLWPGASKLIDADLQRCSFRDD